MLETGQPAMPKSAPRYPLMDVARGLSVVGILFANAIAFAMPTPVYLKPDLSPMALTPDDLMVWWLTHVFVINKFYTLLAILFGASLFLVGSGRLGQKRLGQERLGQERLNQAPEPKQQYRLGPVMRRLMFLALLGLVHGALIWNGDILLLYALCGTLCLGWLKARTDTFIWLGLGLYIVNTLLIIISGVNVSLLDDNGLNSLIISDIIQHRGSFMMSMAANFHQWQADLGSVILLYGGKTTALMLMGMGLLKSGFLKGETSSIIYLAFAALGLISLFLIGQEAFNNLNQGFRAQEYYSRGQINNESLSLLVTLGYISVLALGLRTNLGQTLLYPLRQMGKMALSLYLMQSLVMTALFFGGRAPYVLTKALSLPWYGRMNHADLIVVVLSLLGVQMGFSLFWLRYFRYGPFEWLWRSATQGRFVAIRV
jgi:uncharacterized protein